MSDCICPDGPFARNPECLVHQSPASPKTGPDRGASVPYDGFGNPTPEGADVAARVDAVLVNYLGTTFGPTLRAEMVRDLLRATQRGEVGLRAAVEALCDEWEALLTKSHELIPYKQDDEVWMPCANAYPGSSAKQRVTVPNHNRPDAPLIVLCESRKCTIHYTVRQLPKRYRVAQEQLRTAAIEAMTSLRAVLASSGADAQETPQENI